METNLDTFNYFKGQAPYKRRPNYSVYGIETILLAIFTIPLWLPILGPFLIGHWILGKLGYKCDCKEHDEYRISKYYPDILHVKCSKCGEWSGHY